VYTIKQLTNKSTKQKRQRRGAQTAQSATLEQLVKSTVRSILPRPEKKFFMNYGANQPLTTCAGGGFPTYINMVPSITTGSTVNTRVGNEVEVVEAKMKLAVNLLPYNVTTNPNITPLYVKIYLVSSRTLNTSTLTATNINSSFFILAPNPLGFQANMLDVVMPINEEGWQVHLTDVVKLGTGYGSATGPVSTSSWFDNSSISHIFEFDISRILGRLRYANNAADPYNKNLFLVMQAVNADGTAGGLYVPAEYHFTFQVKYTDV